MNKDSLPPLLSVGGGTIAVTADHIISLLGLGVGVFGIIVGVFKLLEQRRYNNIQQRKLELDESIERRERENAKSTDIQNSKKT